MLAPAFIFDFLGGMGITGQVGIWIFLLLSAFYIYRVLNLSSKMSEWMIRVAVSFVIIATGLVSGVITGVNVSRFFSLVGAAIGFLIDAAANLI